MQARKEDGRSKKTTKASPQKPIKSAAKTSARLQAVKAVKAPATAKKNGTNGHSADKKKDSKLETSTKASPKAAKATTAKATTKAAATKSAPAKASLKASAEKATAASAAKRSAAKAPSVDIATPKAATAKAAAAKAGPIKAAPAKAAPAKATRAKDPDADLDAVRQAPSEASKTNSSFARLSPWSAPALPPVKIDAAKPEIRVEEGEFQVGETVVYPARGVADIVAVEDKDIGGRRQSFYVLRVHDTEQKILVPVNNASQIGLRRPISEAQVREIFRILKVTDVPLDTQTWNRRYRGFVEKLATGSVFAVAEVLRDLSRVKIVKDGLSFSERQMLERARGLIVKEIAVARAKPEDAVRQQIEAIFA